jgi:hypothetical protein
MIGVWKILEIIRKGSRHSPAIYKASCECGKIRASTYYKIKKSKKCKDCMKDDNFINKIGCKFGKFTILSFKRINKIPHFETRCRCGFISLMATKNLLSKNGCIACQDGIFPGVTKGGWRVISNLPNAFHVIECVHCGVVKKRKFRPSRIHKCDCQKEEEQIQEALKKIGSKYKYLKVNGFLGKLKGHLVFEMKCICGKKFPRNNGHLFKSESCGCRKSEALPIGEKASNATFYDTEIKAIREMYDSKIYSFEDICKMYPEREPRYMKRILSKQIWKRIK